MHDVRVTAIEARRHPRATGAMMQVDLGARELLLRFNDGREVTYAVPVDCELLLDGQPAKLDDLKKFYKLEIAFEPRPGEPGVSRSIDARRNQ